MNLVFQTNINPEIWIEYQNIKTAVDQIDLIYQFFFFIIFKIYRRNVEKYFVKFSKTTKISNELFHYKRYFYNE